MKAGSESVKKIVYGKSGRILAPQQILSCGGQQKESATIP
jgi:hypothetical protein